MISEYEQLKELTINIWKRFYSEDAPDWEPLDDIQGLISQIDNMVSGLIKELPENNW